MALIIVDLLSATVFAFDVVLLSIAKVDVRVFAVGPDVSLKILLIRTVCDPPFLFVYFCILVGFFRMSL